ncbi:MAG: hypothetical protein WDW38_002825 [Sanguina aurantia]
MADQRKRQRADDFISGEPCRKVFISNLPFNIDWEELKMYFRSAGHVVYAGVMKDKGNGQSKGCGIVEFETADQAHNAIRLFDGSQMAGRVVYVKLDDSAPAKPVRGRESDVISRDPRTSSDLSGPPSAKRATLSAEPGMREQQGFQSAAGNMQQGMMHIDRENRMRQEMLGQGQSHGNHRQQQQQHDPSFMHQPGNNFPRHSQGGPGRDLGGSHFDQSFGGGMARGNQAAEGSGNGLNASQGMGRGLSRTPLDSDSRAGHGSGFDSGGGGGGSGMGVRSQGRRSFGAGMPNDWEVRGSIPDGVDMEMYVSPRSRGGMAGGFGVMQGGGGAGMTLGRLPAQGGGGFMQAGGGVSGGGQNGMSAQRGGSRSAGDASGERGNGPVLRPHSFPQNNAAGNLLVGGGGGG